ncbi:LysR family transcriptional regulator [Gordonia sp. CPCC 206044]|uniref:LysR family transcriptional regulator n=1 Tax=Gordonia sp. CPCC 206044 TaxID=3140793 RepID=UPI003AF3B14F
MDLTIAQLRYFLAVAETLHFTRAAKRLHISPPSLSQQIQHLEKRVGGPLFERTSRHVELTARGAELVTLARTVITAMDDVVSWADGGRRSPPVFRVGVPAASERANAVLAAAVERHPDVAWQVHGLRFTEPIPLLRDGSLDVSLMVSVDPPNTDDIVATPLWSEDRVLVVHTGHRLADRASVRLEETDDETYIGIRDSVGTQTWFVDPRPSGAHPRILPLAAQFDEVLQLCAAGVGVNISGSSAAVTYARPGLRYIPISDLPPTTTFLCRKRSHGNELIEAFERIAVEVAGGT